MPQQDTSRQNVAHIGKQAAGAGKILKEMRD